MYKIAIVGTSKHLSENEERDIRQYCSQIIKSYHLDDIIITGGAVGVDSIAVEIANQLRYKTKVYYPKTMSWEDFKKRNLQIAKNCNELFCITTPVHDMPCYHHIPPQNHQKTAGCYTMNKAKELGKQVTLFITPKR